eukprot:218995-Prorocentrum_minimum.AAC.1
MLEWSPRRQFAELLRRKPTEQAATASSLVLVVATAAWRASLRECDAHRKVARSSAQRRPLVLAVT